MLLFPYLEGVFKKYKYELGNLYQLFNMYICFGTDWLLEDSDRQDYLISIIERTVFNENEYEEYQISTASQGVILLQLLFLYAP